MSKTKLSARTQEMQKLIKTYQASGLTQKQFCIQAQIPRSTFQFWLKRFRNRQHLKEIPGSSKFIPLEVKGTDSASGGCRVCYPNGITLYFEEMVPADFLAALIKAGNG
jgi:predicted acetyltransferase